jgi:hypothetical protein
MFIADVLQKVRSKYESDMTKIVAGKLHFPNFLNEVT